MTQLTVLLKQLQTRRDEIRSMAAQFKKQHQWARVEMMEFHEAGLAEAMGMVMVMERKGQGKLK